MPDAVGAIRTSGTPGNVLTENAAGVAPTFQAVAGGSGVASAGTEAHTTTYGVVTGDAGKVFTNEGSSGAASARPFNLPTAASGEGPFMFINQVGATTLGTRIVANSGDTIRLAGTVSITAGYIESTAVGDLVVLVAINATEWYGYGAGTWEVETS